MTLPEDVTKRLQRLGLSEKFLENACCALVSQQWGVDPDTTNEQWARDREIPNTSNSDPMFGPDQPIWKGQIYHVLNFIEMSVAMNKAENRFL
jgi:hypothetical protein